MCEYPKARVKRLLQLAAAKLENYYMEYKYKVYVTAMLRIMARPYCQNDLISWVDWVHGTSANTSKKESNINNASVDDMVNDVISKTGLTIVDKEVENERI